MDNADYQGQNEGCPECGASPGEWCTEGCDCADCARQEIGICDNCNRPVMEDDDYLSDDEGIIHGGCNVG